MLGVGIDFGTSNSSVALFDGSSLAYVDLEPADSPADVMPTALYLDREYAARVGRSAIARYVADNAGRTVVPSREEVGEIVLTVAGTDAVQGNREDGGAIHDHVAVHAFTDGELPGRLFRSVKRWLGHVRLERVKVFDRRYRIVALATPVLDRLRQAAERDAGGRLPALHVGRPVHYEGRDEDADRVAVERMLEACRHAGFPRPTLYPEPVAAALSWLHRHPVEGGPERTVLAFDFGGGTLDLCLLRVADDDVRILATAGSPLGGDLIDRMLYRAMVFPELGAGSLVRRPQGDRLRSVPFAFREFADRLLNWPLAYELNRPELLELLAQGAREPGDSGRRIARLKKLVAGNHAYAVFRAIERAKVALSEEKRATIGIPELDLEVPIERSQLETVIDPLLSELGEVVEEALAEAELEPSQVDIVVRTGGSSRIPAVIRRLDGIFPGRVVEHDPFTSIAAGLAIASHRAQSAAAPRLETH